jgi:hypothetical protein
MHRTALPVFLVALAGLAASAGCNRRPECVRVSGKVLLDGKPVRGGTVRVVPLKNRRAEGAIDAEGRFVLATFERGDGCVRGTHPVEVLGVETLPNHQIRWLVPLKYQQASTSGVTVNITGPTDQLVIDLKSDGAPLPVAPKMDTGGDFDPSKMR